MVWIYWTQEGHFRLGNPTLHAPVRHLTYLADHDLGILDGAALDGFRSSLYRSFY